MSEDTAAGRSRMAEDVLSLIWKVGEWDGRAVTTNELAGSLGVSASTVSGNLRRLSRDGLLDYEPYGSIHLTRAGQEIALDVVRRHRLIETYLVERLGFGWDEVHDEAHLLEHAVSDRLLERLDEVLGHPSADPHGDPIPDVRGRVEHPPAERLADLPAGAVARVVRVSDHSAGLLRYLEAREIPLGSELRIQDRAEAAGVLSVTLSTGSGERAVEVTEVAASAIWVTSTAAPS